MRGARPVLVGLATALLLNGLTWGQSRIVEIGGARYVAPASHAEGQLKNTAGVLDWSNDVAPGLVFWTTAASCPSGYTEDVAGRGRYTIGLVAGGTNEATVGTALSNGENRAAGVHTHPGSVSVSSSVASHGHSVTETHQHGPVYEHSAVTDTGGGFASAANTAYSRSTDPASTGVTFQTAVTGVTVSGTLTVGNTSGTVAGTNAPAIQLLGCEKL